ncbi:MAG TPA: S8 family peptidase [Actinomycetota bacterium]
MIRALRVMLRITLCPHTLTMQRDRSSSWFGSPERAPAIVLDQAMPDHRWGRLASLGMVLLVLASLLRLPTAALLQGKLDLSLWGAAHDHSSATIPVIVRETDPHSEAAEALVRGLGGTITHELPMIDSFSAKIPARTLPALTSSSAVLTVTGDGRVRATGVDMTQYDGWSPNNIWDDVLRLPRLGDEFDGTGVTVAVLDTGVIDSPDLAGRVLVKVDFTADHDGIDRYGHGTHMAGIIAGDGTNSGGQYKGVAPGAKIVSVKIAGANGATDVSAVIAGIQWVVAHKAQYNIRVLNLSYGTDSKQSYLVDPLDYAVEQAWFSGILVVVAAGNRGPDAGTIAKPADDPFVVTVGAANTRTSIDRTDDLAAAFSSRGPTQDGVDKPDLLAPGISLVSIRTPGSTIDQAHPTARIGDDYFKGTGTSQAAAVISGVAARLFHQSPGLSPDVVKNILEIAAFKDLKSMSGAGKGLADGKAAHDVLAGGWKAPANVGITPSTGTGSLEQSRGSFHVFVDSASDGLGPQDADGMLDALSGEVDALGNDWKQLGWKDMGLVDGKLKNLGWTNNEWSASAWTNLGWTNNGWGSTDWKGFAWTNLEWGSNGWDSNGWDNIGWLNDGWMSNGWDNDGWMSNGWGRALVREMINEGCELIGEPC